MITLSEAVSVITDGLDGYQQEHVSWSQIGMYMRCAMQHYHRYVLGLKMPPGGPMLTGDAFHRGLAFGYQAKIDTGNLPPSGHILDCFDAAFEEVVRGADEIDWQGKPPGFYKDSGVRLTTEYVHVFAPRFNPLAVEQYFEIPTAHGIPLIGYIDLVAETGQGKPQRVLADYKFAKRKPDQNKHYLQLLFYQRAAAALGLELTGSQLQAAVYGRAKPGIDILEYPGPTKVELAMVMDLVNNTLRAINSGIFPPTGMGTWACTPDWCGYYQRCRERKL